MKKLLFVFIALFFFVAAQAYIIKTEVYKVGEDPEGNICCLYMSHWIYSDDGIFLTYGFSTSAFGERDCCPKKAGVDYNQSSLTQEQIQGLEEFFGSTEFENHVNDAIDAYVIERENGISSLTVLPNPSTGIFRLEFNSNQAGNGKLEILPILGGNIHTQTVSVVNGQNIIEVNYVPIGISGPNHYIVRIVIGNQVFKEGIVIN
jgi:hypothetical protein